MHAVAETTALTARKAETMTRIAGSGNIGLVTLANTLSSVVSPRGIVNPITGLETKVPGFSTDTALNLFAPMENVIAQNSLLIEQQTVRGFLERQEKEGQDRLPAWARATRRLDDNDQPRRDLKQRARDLIEELNAKFQPDDAGAVFANRNPSADARPTEVEIFPNTRPSYAINGGLSFTNMPRLGVTPGETLAATELATSTMNATPEKVLVRLDNGSRDSSEGGNNALTTPSGHLDLNGTTLAGNTVHELTYAEYQQLNYVAGGKGELDYLSVIGVDDTASERG